MFPNVPVALLRTGTGLCPKEKGHPVGGMPMDVHHSPWLFLFVTLESPHQHEPLCRSEAMIWGWVFHGCSCFPAWLSIRVGWGNSFVVFLLKRDLEMWEGAHRGPPYCPNAIQGSWIRGDHFFPWLSELKGGGKRSPQCACVDL